MATILGFLGPFAFYWLILFVACFAVVEFGQNYLYDETTPGAGTKVAIGSAILALILMWTRTEFHTMFTADIGKTVVLAVAAFAVFTLAFRFQPWHALPIGLVAVLLISGTATMGVQSFVDRNRPLPTQDRPDSKPLRRSTTIAPVAPLPDAKDSAKKDAAAKK